MQIIGHGARLVRIAFIAAAIAAALFSARLALTTGSPEAGQAAVAFALTAGLLLVVRRSVGRASLVVLRRVTPDRLRQSAVSAAVSGTGATLAGYVAAVVLLADGPSNDGWAALLLANRIAVATVLVSATLHLVIVAMGCGRARERMTALALLAAGTAIPVLALILLGDALDTSAAVGSDQQAIVLAMRAVGRELLILPAVLAVAASAMPLAVRLRTRRPQAALA